MAKDYKVVYFDEDSAGDYLNISNKGVVKENTEKSTNKQTIRSLVIDSKANLVPPGFAIAFITSFLLNNGSIHFILGGIAASLAAISIALDLSYKRNREDKELVSTQVTSTILSQFLEKQREDRQILCIRPTDVHIEENSFSFIMFYGPVLKTLKTNSEVFDISKLGDVMKETKGYYELIANIREDQSKEENYYILRLNAGTFRNNYKLTDLLHMRLTYYGIKVGKMSLDEMNIQHMLNIKEKSSITSQQAYSSIEQGKSILEAESENKNKKREIIDVILAGVGEYGEN